MIRKPWLLASLIATTATPAAVVLAWLVPRPLDVVLAPPLVALDVWAARAAVTDPWAELGLLALGIGLTWGFYLLLARLVLRRLERSRGP
ncbi:MAG TPA: hypothetical protein VEB59_04030 [Gemmatimonadales bacterium]|nr:hypothetical protein [Gemmatimonadales bacterium]